MHFGIDRTEGFLAAYFLYQPLRPHDAFKMLSEELARFWNRAEISHPSVLRFHKISIFPWLLLRECFYE